MTNEKRMDIERQITARIVQDALAAGYMLSVDETLPTPSGDAAAINAALREMDEDNIQFHLDGRNRGAVFLVYGNSGWDVISDYSMALERTLEGAIRLADNLEGRHG